MLRSCLLFIDTCGSVSNYEPTKPEGTMGLSSEMRLLQNRWNAGGGWPKRLEWMEILGLRGWQGQKIEFGFPIVAVVGENGSGKSTVLQCAASLYQPPPPSKGQFASDYFPDTTWDQIRKAQLRFSYRQGQSSLVGSIRKLTDRWRGNPERPERPVRYIDLSRLQPVAAKIGYKRLANPSWKEASATTFTQPTLQRLSQIMGRQYDFAKMALTTGDPHRTIPVIGKNGMLYSGFHCGAGEITGVELLEIDPVPTSLILIDEIETSLHPRAQRRLIRDLAEKCRQLDLQIILTTHSPYVLEELPLEGRLYIIDGEVKQIARGVSPEFAMTKMDEEPHPECDIYVEDPRSAIMLREILIRYRREYVRRCRFVPFGAASVGTALGQMVQGNRFPTPSCVYLDGDQPQNPGCYLLPGGDAPERVVFAGLNTIAWNGVAQRVGRDPSEVIDACKQAMTLQEHRDWVKSAADKLVLGGDHFWEALCSCWATQCLREEDGRRTIRPIEEALVGPTGVSSTSVQMQLFGQSASAAPA